MFCFILGFWQGLEHIIDNSGESEPSSILAVDLNTQQFTNELVHANIEVGGGGELDFFCYGERGERDILNLLVMTF